MSFFVPAGVEVDFGAGSKLLRGAATLEDAGGATRPAPLGVSLEGRDAFRTGCSSLTKVARVAGRPCSGCALSPDWVLETEETLELRTKPNAASLAAGRREYPGGRRPDFRRLDFAAFELEAFFKSAEGSEL